MTHSPFQPNNFGIIGAMEAEIVLLKQAMDKVQKHQFGQTVIYTGLLSGKNISLCLSGIGKVNAAIATTLLIEHFSADCIINTGSAGGLRSGLHIGDVVIGTEVLHHDVDVSAFGYAYGQIPQLPARYTAHTTLMCAAELATARLDNVACTRGLIASGDQFIHSAQQLAQIRERFPDICAVEMEAAAIAQTCWQFGKPFVIIRAISDNGDEKATVSFDAFLATAAQNSAQMVRHLIAAF